MAFVVFSVGMLVLMGTGMNMGLALVLTGAGMAWRWTLGHAVCWPRTWWRGGQLSAAGGAVLHPGGELMNSGGISRRIIDMAQAWVGHIRGGAGLRGHWCCGADG